MLSLHVSHFLQYHFQYHGFKGDNLEKRFTYPANVSLEIQLPENIGKLRNCTLTWFFFSTFRFPVKLLLPNLKSFYIQNSLWQWWLVVMSFHRITEGLRLEGISGVHLIQLPAQAGTPRASCPGPCPDSFWISPAIGTPQPLWATS